MVFIISYHFKHLNDSNVFKSCLYLTEWANIAYVTFVRPRAGSVCCDVTTQSKKTRFIVRILLNKDYRTDEFNACSDTENALMDEKNIYRFLFHRKTN